MCAAHSARLWLALTAPPISRPIGNAARSSTSARLTADLTPIRNLFIPSCRTPEAAATFSHFRACAAFGVAAWPVRYLTRHYATARPLNARKYRLSPPRSPTCPPQRRRALRDYRLRYGGHVCARVRLHVYLSVIIPAY